MVERQHSVILDWDGTLVPSKWPERPMEFMPGAVQAVAAMHNAGLRLTVQTARMNPYDPQTHQLIPAEEVLSQKLYVRAALDRMGLTFVDVWDKPGKPSGSAYVDDKAYRYAGRPRSWAALANVLIMHLAGQPAEFPTFPRTDDLEDR